MEINSEWINVFFPKKSSYFKIEKTEFDLPGWKHVSKYQYIYLDLAIIETKEEARLFNLFWSSSLQMEFGAIISNEKLENKNYILHSDFQNINYYLNKKYKDQIRKSIFLNSIYIS